MTLTPTTMTDTTMTDTTGAETTLAASLDRYSATAETHMRRHLPTRYRQLTDPESYFRQFGEAIAAQVEDLTQALLEGEEAETGYLRRAGQLTSARRRAEEIVLAELAYLTPEETSPPTPTPITSTPAAPASDPLTASGLADPGWEDWQAELWHRGLDPDTGRALHTDREIQARARRAANLRPTAIPAAPRRPG